MVEREAKVAVEHIAHLEERQVREDTMPMLLPVMLV